MARARWLAVAATTVVALLTTPSLAADMHVRQPGAGHLTQGPRDIVFPAGAGHRATSADTQPPLTFKGGQHGLGVQHHPAVYLVFWGSQWRRSDPYAAYEQRFFRGLYGPGDTWTGLQREWCDRVASDTTACPATAPRIGGPNGPLVKGVWFDDSVLALPTDNPFNNRLTPDAVSREAVRAAAHFGNTTAAENRDAQYLINEPSRFDSPGFGLYCGYHSYVTSNYGPVAYADLPYMTDLGLTCGENWVNRGTAGTYDGVSIIAGHEFIETLTDPWINTGWTDANGQENADKCEWKTSGPGMATNLVLKTGTFAVQGTWSNRAANGKGECVNHT